MDALPRTEHLCFDNGQLTMTSSEELPGVGVDVETLNLNAIRDYFFSRDDVSVAPLDKDRVTAYLASDRSLVPDDFGGFGFALNSCDALKNARTAYRQRYTQVMREIILGTYDWSSEDDEEEKNFFITDARFLLEAMRYKPEFYNDVEGEIEDEEHSWALEGICLNPAIFNEVSDELQRDFVFIVAALKKNLDVIDYVPKELKDTEDFWFDAMEEVEGLEDYLDDKLARERRAELLEDRAVPDVSSKRRKVEDGMGKHASGRAG